MTDTHSTSRAVGLAVLLLLSVVGGSVAVVGTVAAEEHGDAALVQDSITEHRGDVVTLDVELNETDTAYVTMSYEGEYGVLLEVVDGNNDSRVGLSVNTYYARVNDVTAGIELTEESEAAGDELTVLDISTPADASATPLPTGTYDVAVGTELDGDALAEEQDTAEVTLEAGGIDRMQVWTAPYDRLAFDTREQFFERVGLGGLAASVTESEYVAKGDYVVVQMDVSGVYGQVDYRHDLTGVDEFGEPSGIQLSVEEVNPSATADEVRRVDLTSPDNVLVVDAANDTMYMVVTTNTDTFESDTVYKATFELNENNLLMSDDDPDEMARESVSRTFAITDRRARLRTDGTLAQSATTALRGTTSAAPGTELTVQLNASGDAFPMNQTVTADEGRTFTATFDLSEVAVDTNVSASVRWHDEVIGNTTLVVTAVEDQTATPEPTTTAEPTPTPEPTPEPTTTAAPTTATGGGGDGGDGGGGTATTSPGFGLVAAVVALAGAALLAARSRR